MHQPMARMLIAIIASVLVAACSGSTASTAPASDAGTTAPTTAAPSTAVATATATARPSTTPGPGDVVYGGRIDVGRGRKLEVRCAGVGSPTILLEGGGTSPTIDSYPTGFFFDLAQVTTTCEYSHGGAGMSSAPEGTRTMAGVVGDAYAMLAALKDQANVDGPYIFTGWSFGGTVALAEALAHPDRTAGLVILDTDFVTEFMNNCVKSGRTKADCEQEYQDDIEAKSLEQELLPLVHPLPDIPLRIVSAMEFPGCDPAKPETLKANLNGRMVTATDCTALAEFFATEQHKGWSTINPKLEQTRVEADHDGLIDEAGDRIGTIILDLVREARANP